MQYVVRTFGAAPQYLDGNCVLHCDQLKPDPALANRQRCEQSWASWARQYPAKAACVKPADAERVIASCAQMYGGTITQATFVQTMNAVTTDPCAAPPPPQQNPYVDQCHQRWLDWLRDNPGYAQCLSRADEAAFVKACSLVLAGAMTPSQGDAAWHTYVTQKCGVLEPEPVPPPQPPPAVVMDTPPLPPMAPVVADVADAIAGGAPSLPSGGASTNAPMAQSESHGWWWLVAAIGVVGAGAYLLR